MGDVAGEGLEVLDEGVGDEVVLGGEVFGGHGADFAAYFIQRG